MNAQNLELASALVGAIYTAQGRNELNARHNELRDLLAQRCLPRVGLSDSTIEWILMELSMMDSNNFSGNVGVGEREGRVASEVVRRRHFGLSHGMGRSGDVTAVQPKAAGSSIIVQLTNSLVSNALKLAGMPGMKCLVLPVSTGMAITMVLLSLRQYRPHAKYVVWSRIDQKSCLKAITTAGYIPLVVPLLRVGDQLTTNMDAIRTAIISVDSVEQILGVISTTSCFAPRVPDDVVYIGRICAEFNIFHIINHAYGSQLEGINQSIVQAISLNKGRGNGDGRDPVCRVDAVVMSTDKNFLCPVGGAVVATPKHRWVPPENSTAVSVDVLSAVNSAYPGRASISPILDLFITLLHLGQRGYEALLSERKRLFPVLLNGLQEVAQCHGRRVLDTKKNGISIAFNLGNDDDVKDKDQYSFIGASLFQMSCSGARVVTPNSSKTVCGIVFKDYGSHCDDLKDAYLTAACAIGMKEDEIHVFLERLDKCLTKNDISIK